MLPENVGLALGASELKSAGPNVNTPVPLLYDNVPLPLALAVVTLILLGQPQAQFLNLEPMMPVDLYSH